MPAATARPLQARTFGRRSRPRGRGAQFAVLTTDSFEKLNDVVQRIMAEATASHLFMYMDSDLKFDQRCSHHRHFARDAPERDDRSGHW